MAKLEEIMAYICSTYPYPEELSKARLTKIIYLADWESAVTRGKQISDIKWEFNHYGPYVSDVIKMAEFHPDFEVVRTTNAFGHPTELIRLRKRRETHSLEDTERNILDRVIRHTSRMYWRSFLQHVYETYPVQTQPRYSRLDLVRLAKEFRRQKPGSD